MEEWRDIEGYEGLYQVSNLGRVRSLPRKVWRGRGFQNMDGRILIDDTCDRYNRVTLCKDGKKTFRVHQLVAIAFLGHDLNSGLVVDHINNDPIDNRVENLQVITIRENLSKDKRGVSKYTGVTWAEDRGKWRAIITVNGKSERLGQFDNEEEAAEAYNKRLAELCLG